MGRVELFHSRRANFHRCEFWVRDERDATGSPEQWIMKNQPSGHFYARPLSSKSNQMEVTNGVWAYDSNRITLETDEHIPDISRGCLVRFGDELWIVENVQKEIHNKESYYCKHLDYKYTISLTRG